MARKRIKVEIVGMEELFEKLDHLKKTVRNRILRKAVGAGTKIILKTAKGKVPKRFGILKKSMGRKTKTSPRTGITSGIVGPRFGFKQDITVIGLGGEARTIKVDPVNYAHLVEYGTAAHDIPVPIGKTGKVRVYRHPGAKAQPFLRPAADSTKGRIKSAMAEIIGSEIVKEATKKK